MNFQGEVGQSEYLCTEVRETFQTQASRAVNGFHSLPQKSLGKVHALIPERKAGRGRLKDVSRLWEDKLNSSKQGSN